MQPPICLLETGLADLFAQVTELGILTLADRYGLLAAILDEDLSTEEMTYIDRILYSVRKGRVRLVNELSLVKI